MEPLPCLQEVEFIHLSKDIPHTSYTELCVDMGYSHAWTQSILASHRGNYNEAMVEILIKWNTEQAETGQSRSILATKLHTVALGGLGKKLSKGEYLPKKQDPHGQGAAPLQSSSDIYSEKISESLTVQQCRERLQDKYLNQLCKIQMKPWDQSNYAELEDMHTVVTVVTKDNYGKDTKKKEILQGSVAEIFSTKVNGKLPARILVSAPAGGGKTTAVAKIAYDWAHRKRGSALEHLPLLFVVKFRNTNQLTSIGEAIKSQLLSDVNDLTPEGLESFIRANQGICHIILDGLDEYAGISSSNRSLGSNIVSVIRWEEFPECRVLVTTRPHLENFFNQAELSRVYTKMWIEGFSKESSRDYIDKFFASPSNTYNRHGKDLKVYLDDQPLIDELVKTPLFCLMVCHLWSEGLLDTKTATQTELIDNVNVFLMHHANARSNDELTKEQLMDIICKLGEIALAGLIDDSKKLVFTPHDFRRVPAILDRACKLGILSMSTIAMVRLPRSHKTTSTTIEFYHKLAQEHSAGKYLAAKTKKYMLRLKISKLDRLLRNIKANIGDYENLIRFTAGTDNSLCIRIMEALLSNRFLDESERYRILLDCSSETTGTQQNVSSLVQRCVNAQSIVLKSPTVYTVVGMQHLPMQLKHEVQTLKFEGSTVTTDVTIGLWSCLRSFTSLNQLSISDSSLSFPPFPPELPSVKKLSAERVTLESYAGVLSSIPGVRDIDVSINVAETSNTFQIPTASRPMSQTRVGDEQLFVHIRLHAWPALTTDRRSDSGESIGGLSLLFGDQTRNQQRLHVSGVKGIDEESLVDLFVKTKQLTFLNSGRGGGSLSDRDAVQNARLEIQQCQLTTEMTEKLWFCLRSFASLNQLSISDSSLCFPPSLPELPSVKKLSAERVTSQSYEGVLSSVPGLEEIDITIGDDKTEDISQIQTSLHRHLTGHDLTLIDLSSLQSEENVSSMSRKRMRGLGLLVTECQAILSGVVFGLNDAMIDLVQSLTRLMSASLYVEQFSGSLNSDKYALNIDTLKIQDCQLSPKMTEKLWSSLRSFTSLKQLSISDSSLSFPPFPPTLLSVRELSAKRVTSQSYEGVLSSVPGVREIDAYIDVAETSNTFQLSSVSRPMGQTRARDEQFFLHIRLHAWPALTTDRRGDSGESIGGLSLLFGDQTRNQHRLHVSGVKGRDEESVVDLFVKTKQLTSLFSGICRNGGDSRNNRNAIQNTRFEIQQCQLSIEMTEKLWSCLKSFTSLNHLTISPESSLSFPPSPPEIPSVTKLSAEIVTSQSYEGLLSSLPGLREIDITIDDAERDLPQITACLRWTGGQQLTHIDLIAPSSLPSEKKSVSRETMRELGLLIREHTKNLQWLCLSRVECRKKEGLVELVESCRHVRTLSHLMLLECGTNTDSRPGLHITGLLKSKKALTVIVLHDDGQLLVEKCQLSSEITGRMWSCLRSFTSLNHLSISDSSLRFPRSPPELPSVTKLSAERLTSQSYEGLLSSLPGLRHIYITIDDAERDIPHITASLRRTGGQELTRISLTAPSSLPSQKKSLSRETMRGLGLLIRTKNIQCLCLSRVKCEKEEDLVELVESCRHAKTINLIMLLECGTYTDGSLGLYTSGVLKSKKSLGVVVLHDDGQLLVEKCQLSSEITERMWSCLRSFTSLNHLTISDSSLSFPPSLPELPFVTKLSTERVTSQSYEGLLSSLPDLRDIDITIDDAERDLPPIVACLRQTGGQKLTRISLTGPSSLSSEKESVSRETMRGLGLLIREQTENLQELYLSRVKFRNEKDLVGLVECCRLVKTMSSVWLSSCGTREGGRLESHLKGPRTSARSDLYVWLDHDGSSNRWHDQYHIPHTY